MRFISFHCETKDRHESMNPQIRSMKTTPQTPLLHQKIIKKTQNNPSKENTSQHLTDQNHQKEEKKTKTNRQKAKTMKERRRTRGAPEGTEDKPTEKPKRNKREQKRIQRFEMGYL